HTYFASDIAYHEDKRERGFERQIDVLGADHHGYVSRMKAAYQALGGDPDRLELLIMQLVHLVRSGERAQMSKRAGEFVTLAEAGERHAPHRIAAYALELAQEFTAFYRDCRVVGAEPEAVESMRIALCVASKSTIARCLGLLGVAAPEEM